MKATELRIGNRILFAENGTEFLIAEIATTGLSLINDEEETWIEIDQIEGIPLTNDVIEKYWNARECKDDDGLSVMLSVTTGNFYFVVGEHWRKINYLHDLQNLYFTFTGHELIT